MIPDKDAVFEEIFRVLTASVGGIRSPTSRSRPSGRRATNIDRDRLNCGELMEAAYEKLP